MQAPKNKYPKNILKIGTISQTLTLKIIPNISENIKPQKWNPNPNPREQKLGLGLGTKNVGKSQK